MSNSIFSRIFLMWTVTVAISPMDLDTIDFNANSTAEDTNTLNKAYQNLIETNGSIVLEITNTVLIVDFYWIINNLIVRYLL